MSKLADKGPLVSGLAQSRPAKSLSTVGTRADPSGSIPQSSVVTRSRSASLAANLRERSAPQGVLPPPSPAPEGPELPPSRAASPTPQVAEAVPALHQSGEAALERRPDPPEFPLSTPARGRVNQASTSDPDLQATGTKQAASQEPSTPLPPQLQPASVGAAPEIHRGLTDIFQRPCCRSSAPAFTGSARCS